MFIHVHYIINGSSLFLRAVFKRMVNGPWCTSNDPDISRWSPLEDHERSRMARAPFKISPEKRPSYPESPFLLFELLIQNKKNLVLTSSSSILLESSLTQHQQKSEPDLRLVLNGNDIVLIQDPPSLHGFIGGFQGRLKCTHGDLGDI